MISLYLDKILVDSWWGREHVVSKTELYITTVIAMNKEY